MNKERVMSDEHRCRLERRMSSFTLSRSIAEGIILIHNPDGSEVGFESADFEAGEKEPNQVIPIGQGKQGVVYAAKLYFQNQSKALEVRHCVLKNIKGRIPRGQKPFKYLQEITEADRTSIEHNIVKLIGIMERDGEYFAILPYCDFFLDTALEHLKNLSTSNPEQFEQLKVPLCLHLMLDLCQALIALHLDKGYVHGDIKPANIGYCRGHWCVADMDTAKKIGESVKNISGTFPYIHPESFHNIANISNPSNDLWAMGRTVLELLTQEKPESMSRSELVGNSERIFLRQLRAKYGSGVQLPTLSEKLEEQCDVSIEKRLSIICQCLMRALASEQPDILELKSHLEQLRDELFSTCPPENIEQLLASFYSSIKEKAPFHFKDKNELTSTQYSSSISLLGNSLPATPQATPKSLQEVQTHSDEDDEYHHRI